MKDILVFIDDNCRSCEKVVGIIRSMAQEDASVNIRVVHRRKEPALSARYKVHIVPAVFMNYKLYFYGEFSREEFQRALKRSYQPDSTQSTIKEGEVQYEKT